MATDPVPLLARLIAEDTRNPGGDELRCAKFLASELARHAPDTVEVIEVERGHGRGCGAYVFARWGEPRLLLNTHLDTVPASDGWLDDPLVARVANGIVIGLGAADTKGAIAAALAALDEVRPQQLAILYSGDEEHGGEVMRAFLASGRARGLERAIVCEPTGLRLGTRHRGILALEATVRGEGGHSSRADRLVAPVAELARLAVTLDDWGRARRTLGPAGFEGMCLNVARIDGGVAFNVVPESATLSVSLRPPPGADADALREELLALARTAGLEARVAVENVPFATREPAAFAELLGDAAGPPLDLQYWTEAAFLSSVGIDAVVFGPGEIAQAHAPEEWVSIRELLAARAAFAEVFRGAR